MTGKSSLMRVLLCALNAKYVHSNLALRCLKEYARFSFNEQENSKIEIEIEEYTINQHFNEILEDIYLKKPDLIGFSCYIWNITIVKRLVVELKKVLPNTRLWLGGPQVSYDSKKMLKEYPQLSGIIVGEGEVTFSKLIKGEHLGSLQGITFRDEKNQVQENKPATHMELDRLPFPYQNLEHFSNRIIYYESSRGCPFSCSYCLSSEEGAVRTRSLEKVKEELKIFIEGGVTQVKFVDRTFNCDRKRARAIWKFIQENDNGKVNFHFEIVANLLGEEDFEQLSRLRQGLVQFEIGIQSTNPATLKEINRTMDYPKVAEAVKRLKKLGNIHLHVDLIAGLPKEDAESFANSFNQVYRLKADKLQLGFLKLLVGSAMEKRKESYELITQEMPPYEVMETKWLSFGEILRIKSVEEMLEIYYNSRQFLNSMNYLENEFPSPFYLYESLGVCYRERGYGKISHSREKRYEILLEFARSLALPDDKVEEFRQLLILDYYLRENPKKRPAFAGAESLSKEEVRDFYDKEAIRPNYLVGYQGVEKRKLRNMTHLERINGKIYLFDYRGGETRCGELETT
jgi:radical SAM superfamily enzyme YgiQ (UPF0313 family)